MGKMHSTFLIAAGRYHSVKSGPLDFSALHTLDSRPTNYLAYHSCLKCQTSNLVPEFLPKRSWPWPAMAAALTQPPMFNTSCANQLKPVLVAWNKHPQVPSKNRPFILIGRDDMVTAPMQSCLLGRFLVHSRATVFSFHQQLQTRLDHRKASDFQGEQPHVVTLENGCKPLQEVCRRMGRAAIKHRNPTNQQKYILPLSAWEHGPMGWHRGHSDAQNEHLRTLKDFCFAKYFNDKIMGPIPVRSLCDLQSCLSQRCLLLQVRTDPKQ